MSRTDGMAGAFLAVLAATRAVLGRLCVSAEMKIDLHHHLLQHRRTARAEQPVW